MFKSITIEVIGDQRLVCQSCEQRVEGMVKALRGVRQVRAQARNQRIEVLFDTTVLDATAIAERLAQAGYATRVGSSTADSSQARPESLAGGSSQGTGAPYPDRARAGSN